MPHHAQAAASSVRVAAAETAATPRQASAPEAPGHQAALTMQGRIRGKLVEAFKPLM
jgi:hypothetical protein